MSPNDNEKCPKVGNGVTFCVGSGAFGNIEIGDGIMIGANSVVTKSVLQNNVVLGGVPATIIGTTPGFSMLDFSERVINKMNKN